MNIAIITLFPEMFTAITHYGISARAINNGLVTLQCFNPRDYAQDKHNTVDDRPYGGGPGMVMKMDTLEAALSAAQSWLAEVSENTSQATVVYLTPQGEPATQATVARLNQSGDMILIAGRYEGIDERFIKEHVTCEVSIGDYVLSGGELPAMVVIDALIRLQPGALGDSESAVQDSFMNGLLDCPHFTRPEMYRGRAVPKVLLSGDHGKIAEWRQMQSLGRTAQRRPDLLAKMALNDQQQALLERFLAEHSTDEEFN